MTERPPLRRLLPALLLLTALAALAAAGLYRVGPGEVALVRAGEGPPAVAGEGWHWKVPFRGEVRRLPRAPIPLSSEVEVRTPEGAAIVLGVSGRFGIEEGGEQEWVEASGWQPFADGLWPAVVEAAGPAVRAADPADLFRPEAGERLAAAITANLGAAGVRAEALAVEMSPERNPVAAAVLRNRLAGMTRPTGLKVLVVGWDGADWLMIRPLLEAGRLPNLARLVEGGAAGELRSEPPLLSPLLWTTIATGKPVVEHGVADFLVRDPATGGLVPISSASRKVHALWTILPHFGMTTDVVAWWATWPAERAGGTMVTDRVAYQLFDYQEDPSGEGKVHPPAAWEWIEEKLVPAERIGWDEVSRFVEVDRDELARRWDALPAERRQEDPVNHLRKILATTRSYHAIALELLQEQADLTLVYYEGTDTVGHLFAQYLPPKLPGVTDEEVRRYGGALGEFYEYADELLGELLAAVGDDTVVLLVSDHGFFTGEARPAADSADFTAGAPQWHRLHGVIVGAGRGIRPARVDGASIFDVTPTVLTLLGLPVPADMPGRALPALLAPPAEPIRVAGLDTLETLPRARPQAAAASADLDEERLRELVALGYISPRVLEERRAAGAGARGEGGEGSADRAVPGSATGAAGASDLEAVATEAYNLGRIRQREGDLDGAWAQFEIAAERMPSFGLAWASMAQVEAQRGNHGRSFELLVRGFSKSGTMPQSAITGLVDEAQRAGRLPDAERVLEGMRGKLDGESAFHAALGLLYEQTGRAGAALEEYRRALAIDPLDQLSNEQTVALLRRQGREREARELLQSSFVRAEGQMTAMNQLAVVALRQGWTDLAEAQLRRVLASDPGNPGVLANLAGALARQGRTAEAIELMEQSVERDPTDARNQFNLGALYENAGRWNEALAAFERAGELGLGSARLHVATAKLHFRMGDPGKARAELQKALAAEPGDPEARQLLEALDQGAR